MGIGKSLKNKLKRLDKDRRNGEKKLIKEVIKPTLKLSENFLKVPLSIAQFILEKPDTKQVTIECSDGKIIGDIVKGKEHLKELSYSLEECDKELIICSGFLSDSVVTTSFINELTRALLRGVRITLIYAPKERHEGLDINKFNTARERLYQLQNSHSNLAVVEKDTHAKAIIIDRDSVVIGSYNFLSNRFGKREEVSVKINGSDLANELATQLLKPDDN